MFYLVNLACPKLLHLICQSGIRKLTNCGALYVQDNLFLIFFVVFGFFCENLKEKYGDKYSRQRCLYNDFPNFKRILKAHNDKINSSKKIKLHHYSNQTSNKLLIMKLIILAAIQT